MDISPETWNTQDTIHISNYAQEEGRTKCGYSGPSKNGEQYLSRRRYRDKVWSRFWEKDHPETTPPRVPSHIQLQNPDTIIDAHKYLLTGAGYSCHLGGSASACQIQRGTLSVSHWTEHRVPNRGARERTQGAEGVCSTIEGTTIRDPQYSQSS